ncbi:unnamed protein product [Oncorhynchus mykiss]|uniref:C2H2-type domain-containing protein n=1 Tax=Oncorhynchus mykiss TaxID=8022 RepID=A0A060WTX3_ONCMY|nr:unnamed protein product [Oncorhynchus mykiss]
MSTTESEVEEDQDEPPEKEKETFMMQENKYSETSGAPESLSVSEDEGEKDHLDGEAHEKDETCMEQDDQHTDSPSGGEKRLTASVNERKEELDDEAQNAEEECMEEEDRYSNVSSLEGQNEGTIVSESFKEEEHSLSQGTMDSQGIDASNAQDSAHKLNDNTCAFEYQDSVKDNDSLKVAGQENGKSSSVICGLGLGGSNQTFESCLEFPENQSLKTRFQEIVGSGTQSTNSTYEESASDSIRGSGGKEDHSSFDFLERCLGLNNFGIEQKSCIENEWLRPIDESNVSSCLEEDQASQQNLMRHIKPPDLVRAGLENTRKTFHKVYTADDEQEPPVLSECYGEPLSREDCMSDTEGNQERGETGSIDSTELNQEGGDSTIDNIEDERDFEDQAAQLKSSLHMRKCMHPIVLLRKSELKNDTGGAYQCAACQQATQSIDHLIEHHHCNHSENKLNFCQTCGTYMTCDSLAKKHQCGIIDENAQLSSNMKPQKRKSTGHAFHKCRYCTHTFYRLCDYNKHVQRHSGRTEHKCHRCGCNFSQRRSLNRHLREKKCQLDICKEHVCRLCGKSFASSAKLYKHGYNVHHTKTRSYKCQKCLMTFNYSSNFSRHKKRCKGAEMNEKFKCPLCPRLFKYSYNRSRHLREQLYTGNLRETLNQNEPGLKCNYCPAIFAHSSGKYRHMRKHKFSQPFSCLFCGKWFNTSYSLKKHICSMHMGDKPYRCLECGKRFGKEIHLVAHKKVHQRRIQCTCPFCKRLFSSRTSLVRHIRIHTGEKPFSCQSCGESFRRKEYLQLHQEKCPESENVSSKSLVTRIRKVYKCSYCPREFEKLPRLLLHHNGHMQNTVTPCPKCGKCYRQRRKLHERLCNGSNIKSIEPVSTKTCNSAKPLQKNTIEIRTSSRDKLQHKCPHCPSKFKYRSFLLRHIGASLGEYKCNICTKIFMKSRNLRRHILTHTEVKPYRCKACDSCFSRHDHLKLHQSRCKGKRQRFDCSICSKIFPSHSIMARHIAMSHAIRTVSSFTHEKSLKRHINIGAYKRKFKCTFCPRLFKSGEQLRVHTRLHTGEKPFGCSNCGERFIRRDYLQRHLNSDPNDMNKPIKCPQCNLHFGNKGGFSRHMRTHLGEYPFNCKKCNKGFWNNNLCRKHVRKCRLVKEEVNTDSVITSELDPTLKETVLVFNQDDLKDLTLQNSSGNQGKGRSSHDRRHSERKKKFCQPCGKTFANPSDLARHMRGHWNEKIFSCPQCPQTFPCPSDLDIHRTCHDSNRPFVCKECQQRFWTSQSLENHQSQAHSKELIHTCHVCNKNYSIRKSLEDHQRCHLGEKPHECAECGKCFFQAGQLQQHLRSHKSEYQCQICGRGFVSLFALRKHKHTHGKSRQHRCSKCPLSFTGPSQLAEHMGTHRDDNFPCDICDRTFSCKMKLASHLSIHSENTFACSVCKLTFPNKSKLAEHERSHLTAATQYECTECGQSFLGSDFPQHHCAQHHNERPFKCQSCGKTFALKRYLRDHERRQHNESQYKCSVCPKTLTSAHDLSLHMKVHTEQESGGDHRCDMCYKSFSRLSLLRQHQESHVGQVVYECTECDKAFAFPHLLEEHQMSHAAGP